MASDAEQKLPARLADVRQGSKSWRATSTSNPEPRLMLPLLSGDSLRGFARMVQFVGRAAKPRPYRIV